MLEVVASRGLWFWHTYFGEVGSNNGCLDWSSLFDDTIIGTVPDPSVELIEMHYMPTYYLGDGIYPEYSSILYLLCAPKVRGL